MIQNGKNKQQRKHKEGILEDKNLGRQRGNRHICIIYRWQGMEKRISDIDDTVEYMNTWGKENVKSKISDIKHPDHLGHYK